MGAVSNEQSYFDRRGVSTATTRGRTLDVVLKSDSVMYHSFSFSYTLVDVGLETVFGVANSFDEAPPRVTTLNLGELSTEGNSAFYSQYDWLGRRFFINASYTF